MKTCVYCLEEINEAALVCRHCGRGCLRDVASIHYLSKGWVLGVKNDGFYGIWSAQGGDPHYISKQTGDKHWKRMFNKLQQLEASASSFTGFGVGIGIPIGDL